MVSALALIAGAVLVLTMAPAHAYAAETRGSSVYKTYDGVNYEAYNTLSTAALAMATPRIVASKTLPAGSLGLDAMLVENGSIIDYVTRYTGVSAALLEPPLQRNSFLEGNIVLGVERAFMTDRQWENIGYSIYHRALYSLPEPLKCPDMGLPMEARHTVQLPSATNWGLNLI